MIGFLSKSFFSFFIYRKNMPVLINNFGNVNNFDIW